mmetsp:Transcript_39780/g.127175  ORF Transcript_39780/g.127175 Transcript_39780/m.127175 type:complete len:324 (+) Transcript_39780:591-1562(+)
MGVERGGLRGYLHCQIVVGLKVKSAAICSKVLKGWLKDCGISCKDYHISSKALTGKGAHTPIGMIGYCGKDSKMPWFQHHYHHVGDEMIERGREEYLSKGGSTLKGRGLLTPQNLIPMAVRFHTMKMGSAVGDDILDVLLLMLTSGLYHLCSTFLFKSFQGMDYDAINSAWKIAMEPESVTVEHIKKTIFRPANFDVSSRDPRPRVRGDASTSRDGDIAPRPRASSPARPAVCIPGKAREDLDLDVLATMLDMRKTIAKGKAPAIVEDDEEDLIAPGSYPAEDSGDDPMDVANEAIEISSDSGMGEETEEGGGMYVVTGDGNL